VDLPLSISAGCRFIALSGVAVLNGPGNEISFIRNAFAKNGLVWDDAIKARAVDSGLKTGSDDGNFGCYLWGFIPNGAGWLVLVPEVQNGLWRQSSIAGILSFDGRRLTLLVLPSAFTRLAHQRSGI